MDIDQIIKVDSDVIKISNVADNINACLLMTSDSTVLSTKERYRVYYNISQVIADFGSLSSVVESAKIFFSQERTPISAGGYLVIGFYRATEETVSASKGYLQSADLVEVSVVSELQKITDGSFSIDVDGVEKDLTGLDFSSIDSLSMAVDVINNALTGAVASYANNKIKITSDTTGASSIVTFAVTASAGSDIKDLLGLADGGGAVKVDGADASTNPIETKIQALDAVRELVKFRGYCFTDAITNTEMKTLAAWSQVNKVIGYAVSSDANNLTLNSTYPFWDIKLKGYNFFRYFYRKDGNRKFAIAYMSRLHSVDYNQENSTITMNLKNLVGISAEDYTSSEEVAMKRVGSDYLATLKNENRLFTSGANSYSDFVIGKVAVELRIQGDLYNALANTTKVSQTDSKVAILTDTVMNVFDAFVLAGFIAPKEWTAQVPFGDEQQFKSNIRTAGYYVLAGRVKDLTVSQIENRESPVIRFAYRTANAVHSVSVSGTIEE